LRIFISYPSEEWDLADSISLRLTERGHHVFFAPHDLPAGGGYDLRLEGAMQKVDLLIFLITPDSVKKGRYTLTELEYARTRWAHPHDHVLPVLVAPTELSEIPPYLRAVTILQPTGDIVAETSAAVDQIGRRQRRPKLLIALTSIVLVSVFAGYGVWHYRANILSGITTAPEICGGGVRRTDKSILSSQPTAELGTYVTGLQQGTYVFNWGIDGTKAASLLGGFSRRFATTYDEILDHFKNSQSVQFSDIVNFAAGVLKNERIIDEYVSKEDARTPAILYLRAYQNLECSFPTDIMNNPPPADAMLEQLRTAYPAFSINRTDPTFKYIYNDTIKLAQQEINKTGYISPFQILVVLRQAILQAPR
jgi:TIR domain